MSALRFEGVHKKFGKRVILDGVDIDLADGECSLLCGRNGAGKSTLLRILAGMERPERGRIAYHGRQLQWRQVRRHLLADCIYLHQTPYLFEGSVRHNLNYPLSGSRHAREAQIGEALEWSGLAALASQDVRCLSGGERQRVALARAWLRRPRVMLLDEPTSNMDVGCRTRTVDLLRALKGEGVAMVVTTHDPVHFKAVADQVYQLENGSLVPRSDSHADLSGKVTPIDRQSRAVG